MEKGGHFLTESGLPPSVTSPRYKRRDGIVTNKFDSGRTFKKLVPLRPALPSFREKVPSREGGGRR